MEQIRSALMRLFILLLFLINIAYATCYYSDDVFMYGEPGASYRTLPLDRLGLHVTYYKNPKKRFKRIELCQFLYTTKHSDIPRKNIILNVYCDFTGPKPAFVVGKVKPDWVECADPLLRVEFQEKPSELTDVFATIAIVRKNAVRYALPFVEGEDPRLDIECKDSKATIVFALGPDNKKSTTIDFLNDLAIKFSPPIEHTTLSPELEALFEEAMRRDKTMLKERIEELKRGLEDR